VQQLRVGFLEPHLLRFGGIRRILELSNRLVERGHDVTIYVPATESRACRWMPCAAAVKHIEHGFDDNLDVLLFNEETQWHLLSLFTSVPLTGFFALHYAGLYDKPGSWEALRTPVDVRLANSEWTADMVERDVGIRPHVLRGGVNREHFRPVEVRKRYPILCVGDERPWKGTDTVLAAGRQLGLHVERYAGKDLPQSAMAAEYCSADVFVVGSRFEGFGQPGLEALACGTPLVTTDNGGSRDYAIHGQTALVVPPGDVDAIAAAIRRLREEPELAALLRRNGLDLVQRRFDWDRSAAELEEFLCAAVERGPTADRDAPLRPLPEDPELSVVVLAWDQLHYTQRCVQSVRRHTDVSYELVIVDNGSQRHAANYAARAADVAILNDDNRGFSTGMNQGLAVARGRYVAFVNNDTALPPRWASRLCSHWLEAASRTGIVVPGVTAAGNVRTVQAVPVDAVDVLAPFEAPPSAVLYLMETDTMRRLGGWGEEYAVASAEDVDLCFKVWVNGLDVIFDRRVLVHHVSKGTAGEKLDDYRTLWARNREVLLAKWTAADIDVPRLERCSPAEFERNVQTARSVAGWMTLYFRARDRFGVQRISPTLLRPARRVARKAAEAMYRRRQHRAVRRALQFVRRHSELERVLHALIR
jgi:GT2 family glycosyltransferase